MWIAFDGSIGAGKTTLTRVLSNELGIRAEFEASASHPFIADFYDDPERYALETEIGFSLIHYHQLLKLLVPGSGEPLVSDFVMSKDLVYGALNLEGGDLVVFERVHRYLAARLPQPTLTVFIEAETDLLELRVKARDRSYERQMPRAYLERLNRAYDAYYDVEDNQPEPMMRIKAGSFDVVNSAEDRRAVADLIARRAGLRPESQSSMF